MESHNILTFAKSFSRPNHACTYYKVDLHIHSPESRDYRGVANITPNEFVMDYATRKFGLIAITDHNTGAYIDRAIEASEHIAKQIHSRLTILPGVEINVDPGIHLLVVLESGGSAEISSLLSRLGLRVDQQGDPAQQIEMKIREVAQVVHEFNGLLIGAHCDSSNGVLSLEGSAKRNWIKNLDALEIRSGKEEYKILKTVNHVSRDLRIDVPITFGSDSHDSKNDSTGMWVKMESKSFNSLRQIIFEPDMRISRTEPPYATHCRIIGFATTHGIYTGARFRFSPSLNVLLGGRGAGKSAAIDLLRFAFEEEPKVHDDRYEDFAIRIVSFLQSVGEICVVVIGNDGQEYAVTRSGEYRKQKGEPNITFTKPAEVLQVVGDTLVPRSLRPRDIIDIEFYGQGEAARLANFADEQLRLIDENLDLSNAIATISEAEGELDEVQDRILESRQRVEILQVKSSRRTELEGRRALLTKSFADPIFLERIKWAKEHSWVKGQENWIQEVQKAISNFQASLPQPPATFADIENSSTEAALERLRDTSEEISQTIISDLDRLNAAVAQIASILEESRAEWLQAFELADKRYHARLVEIGATTYMRLTKSSKTWRKS